MPFSNQPTAAPAKNPCGSSRKPHSVATGTATKRPYGPPDCGGEKKINTFNFTYPMIKKIKQCIGQLLKTRQERRHALVGDGKLWKMKRDFQLEFLLAQGLKKEHRFMDIGCGTLRGGIPVIDYLHPGNYYGIEVREQTLLEARKELKEAGLEHKHPQLINF